MLKKILLTVVLLVWPAPSLWAQITPPYSFSANTTILSSQVNANFNKFSDALNRTGGTITGNIAVDANITIDGVDISDFLTSTQTLALVVGDATTPSFSVVGDLNTGMYFSAADQIAWTLGGTKKLELTAAGLTVTNALSAASASITGAMASGSAAVTGAITGDSLDIAGAIVAGSGNVTIIDSTGKIPAISSTYFASLSGANLTSIPAAQLSGTITSATQDLITRTGTVTSGTWSGSFGAVSGANLTSLSAANLSGTIASATQDLITRTGTITSGVWNAGSVKSSSTVTVAASNQLYMDGGGDTYFIENGANVLSAYAGGNLIWSVPSGTAYFRVEDFLSIQTGSAPALSIGGTVGGSHYGSGSTNWLATPDVWFYIKRNSNAVTYAVPGYGL